MKKIFFKLTVKDDYPPINEESIWGIECGNNLFKINNIPFYTKDISFEDIVSVIEKNGCLYYNKTIKSSGNSTIRIIFFDEQKANQYISHIKQMGCEYEKFSSTFIAINIHITLDIEIVLNYLEYLSSQGIIDYEYGKIYEINFT